MDEEHLRAVAERCRDQVLRFADRNGFTHSDFTTRVTLYRDLPRRFPDEGQKAQFRVLVMLAKMREVSSRIGPRSAAWHFYPRSTAPDGAFNYERSRLAGEIITDAGDKH